MAKRANRHEQEDSTVKSDASTSHEPATLEPGDAIGVTDDGNEVVAVHGVVSLDDVPTSDLAKLWQQARDDADRARAEADKLDDYARGVESTLAKRIVDAGKGLHFTVAARRYRVKRRPEKSGGGYQILSDEIREAVAID